MKSCTAMSKPKHIIYFDSYLDVRAGGPSGYLANLDYGLNQIPKSSNFEIQIHARERGHDKHKRNSAWKNFILMLKQHSKLFSNVYASLHPKYNKDLAKACEFYECVKDDVIQDSEIFLDPSIRSVHCHSFTIALLVDNTLKKLGIRDKIKLMLTSHSPEAPSMELTNSYLERGFQKERLTRLTKACEVAERRAFAVSDILVFPCKEAMEPYIQTIDGFETLIKEKDVRFIPTGSIGLTPNITRELAREKFDVKDNDKVVCFIGRHNEVKGYSFLVEVAPDILQQRENVLFLIAGKATGQIQSPNSSRWRELGWIDPAELLLAADLFVLPNKRTYFDLVLIEALSVGIPILASATGGNKNVFAQTDAITLYSPENHRDFIEKLKKLVNLTEEERGQIVQKCRLAYKTQYSAEAFATNYLHLIKQIYKDYNV